MGVTVSGGHDEARESGGGGGGGVSGERGAPSAGRWERLKTEVSGELGGPRAGRGGGET
jgi:hypothetical protein